MRPLAPRLRGQQPLWLQVLHALWALLLGALLLSAVPSQAQGSGGTITYIHTDISGSALAATDAQGAVVWKESYRGYGQRWLQQGSGSGQSLWFHGKEQDEVTGWQYFGARYYDPAVGRFMGMDPVDFQDGNLHSFNRYAYGNNNPVRYVDPDGGYAEMAVEALSLAIGIDSFRKNIGSGNYAAAAVDGVGVAVDATMAAIPGAPGVVGLGVKALRESGEVAAKGGEALTSRAARRQAMRDAGIPTSQQPVSQSRNASGREYSYDVPASGGGTQRMSVQQQQQQTMDRSHPGQAHWEAGRVKADRRTGAVRENNYGRPALMRGKSKVDY